MAGLVASVDDSGKKSDNELHSKIMAAVRYKDTEAYNQTLNRLLSLGLTEDEAIKIMES
jgi:Fe2+ transport system protein FeoA